MHKTSFLSRVSIGTASAALIAASVATAVPAPAFGAPNPPAVRPANDVTLSVGEGRMVRLDAPMSDLFVANDAVADVQVRSANQVYVFGKAPGETTVFATDKAGHTIYSANVRVGTNIASVDEMLHLAMPEAQIRVTPMNGTVLLTGTVAAPDDVEEATRLVQNYVGQGTQVLSRLKSATPLQVMLQVKVAEVNRSLVRQIGVNLLSHDSTGGFQFGIGQGRAISPQFTPGGPLFGGVTSSSTGTTTAVANNVGSTLFGAGKLLGVDILSALDLAENDGRVHTLAEPNLTALSGETASFLAGGEFPIPMANGLSGTSIEFKQYGVSLAFTPTVLEGGRISMRVRPEVSELSQEGAIQINGFTIPSLTTRRAETTVELGSGQSFMIGGLLRNSSGNTINKAPILGSLPIIGALFRSNAFKRNETELVIVVTPYLVRPVNASQIALPTDGYRSANTAEQVLLGRYDDNRAGGTRPQPHMATPQAAPGIAPVTGEVVAPPQPASPAPQRQAQQQPQQAVRPQQASVAPGFSF
jgi:pilus assembly protein CpaC